MIDIIVVADAIFQMHVIVDGCKNILSGDMLRNKLRDTSSDRNFQFFSICGIVKDFTENRIIYQFRNSETLLVFRCQAFHPSVDVDHHGRKDLDLAVYAFHSNVYVAHCRILDAVCEFTRYSCTCFSENFTGLLIDNVVCQNVTGDSVAKKKLLIKFIAADFGKIISSGIKEHAMNQAFGGIDCQRLARTDLFVQFKKTFLIISGAVLGKGCLELRLIAESFDDFLICAQAKSTDQLCDRYFSCTIDTYIEDIVGVRLIFKPCAAVRDDCTGIESLADLVVSNAVVDTRRTYKLTDDNTFGTVYNEGTGFRHKRQVTHEYFMFLNFAVFLVQQTNSDVQRSCVIRVTLFALLDRILDLVSAKLIIHEFQAQLIAEVFNRRDVIEDFFEAHIYEPIVGRFLHLDQIGHFQNFSSPLVAHSNRFSGLNWTNSVFLHSTFHPVISIYLLCKASLRALFCGLPKKGHNNNGTPPQ